MILLLKDIFIQIFFIQTVVLDGFRPKTMRYHVALPRKRLGFPDVAHFHSFRHISRGKSPNRAISHCLEFAYPDHGETGRP